MLALLLSSELTALAFDDADVLRSSKPSFLRTGSNDMRRNGSNGECGSSKVSDPLSRHASGLVLLPSIGLLLRLSAFGLGGLSDLKVLLSGTRSLLEFGLSIAIVCLGDGGIAYSLPTSEMSSVRTSPENSDMLVLEPVETFPAEAP